MTTAHHTGLWSYVDPERQLRPFSGITSISPQSEDYVKKVYTGGYGDWRTIPRIDERAILYDSTQENIITRNHNPKHHLALSTRFSDGAVYLYWSSDVCGNRFTDCYYDTLYFVNGTLHTRQLSTRNNGGVRTVRKIR